MKEKHPALIINSETIRCWLQFDDGFNLEVLSILPSSENNSVAIEIEESGLENFFDLPHKSRKVSKHHDIYFGKEYFAITQGIIPYQPFYTELSAHYYYSHAGDEWDCDLTAKILEITKKPKEEIISYWKRWVKDIEKEEEQILEDEEISKNIIFSRPDLLFIRTDHFYVGGYYDDMSPPTGVRHTLCSDFKPLPGHYFYPTNLISAEDDNDYFKALEKLGKIVKEKYPCFKDVDVFKIKRKSEWW